MNEIEIETHICRRMTVEISRKEAIDNLRVAVEATLLVVPQHEYRIWAQKYLEQSEPTTDLGDLPDRITDSINALSDTSRPWRRMGRALDCWFIIREIINAVRCFHRTQYHQSTVYALCAAERCVWVGERSQREIIGFCKDLERSLYGEVVS